MLTRPAPETEIKRGREIVVPDFEVAQRRLKSEVTRSPVTDFVPVPEPGGMELAQLNGDIFLVDPTDGKEKGAFAWITATPDWKVPEMIWQMHAWGPSERHLGILIDICAWAIAQDGVLVFGRRNLADMPVSYRRSTHPMILIADQYANVRISDDLTTSTTTYRTAHAGLTARREALLGIR